MEIHENTEGSAKHDNYEHYPGEASDTSEIGRERQPPQVYVTNGSDFAARRTKGVWIDAARDPGALTRAIGRMLTHATGYVDDEVVLHDYRRFGIYQLSRQDDLETITTVAQGIDKHGHAYSALAKYLGAHTLREHPERFEQSYLGEWSSLEHFVTEMADAFGIADHLALLPQPIRHYVRLDFQAMVRDVKHDLMVVSHEAGVWVFDPRIW
jgi:antirestriction protein